MEWVETTGKSIEEAKERALDQLGVADDDAEFEVLETPRNGLFGLVRGEARVRARVRPTAARPKNERRRGAKRAGADPAGSAATATVDRPDDDDAGTPVDAAATSDAPAKSSGKRNGNGNGNGRGRGRGDDGGTDRGSSSAPADAVDPRAVGDAAVGFVQGLVEAFGFTASAELRVDEIDLEVNVVGSDLGLLIGPGGRTLLAVQDLARVAAQRRLGDHDTRLRIDVAGYRERRREALERFARGVAAQVVESGTARALEPMPSADRKVVHDVLTTVEGVASHSEGDEPSRRVVITPA